MHMSLSFSGKSHKNTYTLYSSNNSVHTYITQIYNAPATKQWIFEHMQDLYVH